MKSYSCEVLMDYGIQIQVIRGKVPMIAKKSDSKIKYKPGDTGTIKIIKRAGREWWYFTGDRNDETEETCKESAGDSHQEY